MLPRRRHILGRYLSTTQHWNLKLRYQVASPSHEVASPSLSHQKWDSSRTRTSPESEYYKSGYCNNKWILKYSQISFQGLKNFHLWISLVTVLFLFFCFLFIMPVSLWTVKAILLT